MTPDAKTLSVYDAKASQYADLTKPDEIHPTLAAFIALLPSNAQVLDFGCGPGFDAGIIAASGARVDAMDASAKMVEIAQQETGVTAWQANFDDLTAVNKYNAIWASFSLLHAPRADMPRHLSAIHGALTQGGLFNMGLKLGTGEMRDPIGRLYTYYTETELKSLLSIAGFHNFKTDFGRSEGLDGVMADWIAIRCHKTK